MITRIGSACYRHRWVTVLSWVVAVAALIMLWTKFGAPASDNFGTSDPGQTLISQHFPRSHGDSMQLAIRSEQRIEPFQLSHTLAKFRDAPSATGLSPLTVSRDGHIAFTTIQFDIKTVPGSEAKSLIADAKSASGNGITYSLGGPAIDQAETSYGGSSNAIGVGAAAVVLLIAFGSLLAMGLPIATALMGIGSGLSLIALLGHIFPAPSFSAIIAAMIGLGVGVDYALFIVTRFREELRAGLDGGEAIVITLRTAGRSVLTAGTTVVIGMMGLLVLRQQLLTGVAVAAAATVAMTVIASITLLPALLGFSGRRLAKPSRFGRKKTRGTAGNPRYAAKWAGVIQRHPVAAASLSAAAVLALAAPVLAMKMTLPDESAMPRSTMAYQSYQTLTDGFGPGFNAPVIVVGDSRVSGQALAAKIAHTPGVAAVTPPVVSADHQAVMMTAFPTTNEQNPATNALVNKVKAELPAGAYVTGQNAGAVTFEDLVAQRLPWLIAVVVGLSMILLTIVFRSVVIAAKAAVMNLLSITAAYGVLTAISQWGWGGKLFGFPEHVPVATWVPMFLFVILFGLSMDYEVFLLSRIREEWDATGDNTQSVTRGLTSTMRVITAAAAIMIVVFLSFVGTPDVAVKQIGLGLAVAVLVDATVVRLVLVPAVMELLGKANWWMPYWIHRLLGPARSSAMSHGDRAREAASLH